MNLERIDEVVKNQRSLNQSKSNFSLKERLSLLDKLEKSLLKYEKEINEALYEDLRKCHFEAQISEFLFVLNELRSAKKHLKKWMKRKSVKTPLIYFPAKSYILSEPYGSVLIISPWNYPFQLLISPLIGALAAGNRVVVKPSEVSASTSKVISKIISETFDESTVYCVEGGVEETTRLLDNRFDYIFYTGNGHVARIIMEKASKNLTPLTLELGGKSPCFIFGAQKIDLVAKRIVSGKFFNAGQTCIAPDYILVEDKHYEELVNKLEKYILKFFGKNAQKSSSYGRIINERHFDRIVELIESEELLYGGESDKDDLYISPSIISAKKDSHIMKDEIFGPLLPIIKMQNLKEAIDFVSEGEKPLANYIFSEDKKIVEVILDRVSSGGVTINDTLMHIANENLPFGGVGESGMGAYHGKSSFDLFSHKKSVFASSSSFDPPFKYPPYFGKMRLLRWLLKFFG
ncbi:aldehyde dehydrogenase family protein [Halobacteriovorax sp. HLS]|uniref:aldehyde dehydrogenase family protein n=1 Tax=Halobacteriovorax sp. HLS TaxID=2234000 RepID=UPI000FDCA9FC|nr:aldehyde dehydrogenase family protein [Halobacteriovorax sp. HLS]